MAVSFKELMVKIWVKSDLLDLPVFLSSVVLLVSYIAQCHKVFSFVVFHRFHSQVYDPFWVKLYLCCEV
jgi:hypothetical protein